MRRLNKDLIMAALIRALRTVAQTALSMITIGAAFSEVPWVEIASVSAVAGIYSLLLSIAGDLPENEIDGMLLVDTSGETDIYRLDVDVPLELLGTKKKVLLKVDPDASLAQK